MSITLSIDTFPDSVILPSNPFWNELYKDYRNDTDLTGSPQDISFFNLSLSVLHHLGIVPINYRFHENQKVNLTITYKVCNNYYKKGSFLPNDNRFRSLVNMNMYLTGTNLITAPNPLGGIGVYNAYTAHNPAYPGIGSCFTSPQSNWLYVCETRNGYHTFYSVQEILKAHYNNGGPERCTKQLVITSEINFGGQLYNVFPFEFRPAPPVNNIILRIPSGNSNYTFDTASSILSQARAYNEFNCLPYNLHQGHVNGPINIDAFGNIHQTFAQFDSTITSYYNSLTCNSAFNLLPYFIGSDEYSKSSMQFQFRRNNCIYPTEVLIDSTIQIVVNFGSCSQSNDTILSKFAPGSDYILSSPSLSGFIDEFQSQNINVTTTKFCVNYTLRNNNNNSFDESTAENTFILIPDTGLFSTITFTNGAITDTAGIINYTDSNGITKRAFFYHSGNIAKSGINHYEICFELRTCAVVDTIPIYYGWNCGGYPSSTHLADSSFCYIHTDKLLIIHFNSPNVSATLEPSTKIHYNLCQPKTFHSTISVSGAGIHSINLNLNFFAQDLINFDTLNFNPTTDILFWYIDNNSDTVLLPYTFIKDTISPVLGYVFTMPDSIFHNLSLAPGEQIRVDFIYLPVIFDTVTTTPFSLQYNYSSFCDSGNTNVLQSPSSNPLSFYPWRLDSSYCDSIMITAGSDFLHICSGESVHLSAALVVPVSGNLTYRWTSTPPLIIDSVANPTISNLQATTIFTVKAYNTAGDTGIATVTVYVTPSSRCCKPPSYTYGQDYDFSFKTATQVMASFLSNVPSITTQKIILINDTFTVDHDFAFKSCHNIILGPGAVINVLPGDSLILDDCTITSCSVMARGIIAQSGSKVKIQGSWIKDCLYGLEARNLSTIKVKSSYFINNFIGIYLSPFGTSGPISINASITNTEFASLGNLKTPYLTLSPAQPTKPFAGIKLSDVSTVTVGNIGVQNLNKFTNLNYGIYAIRSNLTVYNSRFTGIRKYDNFYAPNYILNKTQGSAIFADGRQGAYHLWQYGRNDTALVDFQNCQNGIYSLSSSVESINNIMINCDNGYWVVNGQNLSLRIANNTINFNQRGIASIGNLSCSNREFINNVLTGGSNQYDLFGHVSNPSAILVKDNSSFIFGGTISGNKMSIRPRSNVTCYGISLLGCGSFHVFDNEINIVNSTPIRLRAISLQNSNQNFIECNHIVGILPSPITSDNKDIAINLETSAGNTVSCNDMMSTSTGLKLAGNCFLPGTPTIIRTNDFGMHYRGLHYTASAATDEQDNMGNQWHQQQPPYAGGGALNEDTNSSSILSEKYIVELGGAFNYPNPVSPPNWFSFSSIIDETCDLSFIHHGLCGQTSTGGGLFSQNFAKLVQIALDSIHTANYNEETQWQAKVALYEYLINTPQYLDSSTSLADFYISCAGTNIQRIADINNSGQDLYNNQHTLIQIINDNAIFIYYQSKLINSCDSALQTELYYETERDSIINYRNILNSSIQSLILYNNNAFHVLDSTISIRADLINNQNDIINGTNKCEENEIIVNDVYFNTVAINQLDALFNYAATLLNIAMQCPLSGGPAVYKARSLYYILDPEMDYDDEQTCLLGGYLFKNSRNLTAHSKLFPNPSKDIVNIVYHVESNSMLQILDCYGRIIKYNSIDPLNYIYSFNVENLENGFYSYRIVNSKGIMIDAGQFIIMK